MICEQRLYINLCTQMKTILTGLPMYGYWPGSVFMYVRGIEVCVCAHGVCACGVCACGVCACGVCACGVCVRVGYVCGVANSTTARLVLHTALYSWLWFSLNCTVYGYIREGHVQACSLMRDWLHILKHYMYNLTYTTLSPLFL